MLRNLSVLGILTLCLSMSGSQEAKAFSSYDETAINFNLVGASYSWNSYTVGARNANAYYAYYYGYYAYYYSYYGQVYNDYNYWSVAYNYSYYANIYATNNFNIVGYDSFPYYYSYYGYYYAYYGYVYTYHSFVYFT